MNKIKIFIVTTEIPARIGGVNVRNLNLIKWLSKKLYSVTLFTIVNEKTEGILPEIKKELNIPIYAISYKHHNILKKLYCSIFKRIIPYMEEFNDSGMDTLLLKKIREERPDIIQLESINAYYIVRDIIPRLKKNKIKIILDAHDVSQIAFNESLRSSNFIKKMIGKWILPNFAKIENNAITTVNHIFTCSDIDKAYFSKLVAPEKINIVPNGVDTAYFKSHKKIINNTVLFMGAASYPPNNEALKYYLIDIYPLVKKNVPDLKTYILCGNTPLWIKEIAKNDTSIIIPGFVADVRKYLNKAKICIAPIKSGSGTRLKILEYLAAEKPVIATTKAAEGLKVINNKDIILTDTPTGFSNAIIDLCTNNAKADKLANNGRELVLNLYEWKEIASRLQNTYYAITT